MKNLILSLSIALLVSALSLSSHADPMAVVKGRTVFIAADDSLTIFPDSPNQQLTCSYDTVNDIFIPGASVGIQVPLLGATDVKVIGSHAYVATSRKEGSPTTGYVKYNVSACLPDVPFTPTVATADLTSGELVIPCVVIGNNEYNVVMNRRGNSMNWEVIFAESGCY